ncbi:hypothetical protein BLOT_001278 [Blomia tropicalis]|nr:hypothetical protein BLOT_001278 [Blomia tropicalis]
MHLLHCNHTWLPITISMKEMIHFNLQFHQQYNIESLLEEIREFIHYREHLYSTHLILLTIVVASTNLMTRFFAFSISTLEV